MTTLAYTRIHSGWLRRSTIIAALTFGVCLLAVPTQSEAKIVYTAVDVSVNSGHIKIDLNHDGTKDFDIQAAASSVYCGTGSGGIHAVVTIAPNTGDGVVVSGGTSAAALASGVSVASGLAFDKYQSLMTNSLLSRGCGSYRNGNWCSGYAYSCSKTAYLGLKFLINGQTHYGWAYVTVSGSLFSGLTVTLRGFAYDTIAGHAITTGQTSGT
jgi:hypothetical protein